jgi:hypothetical protein
MRRLRHLLRLVCAGRTLVLGLDAAISITLRRPRSRMAMPRHIAQYGLRSQIMPRDYRLSGSGTDGRKRNEIYRNCGGAPKLFDGRSSIRE